MSSPAAALSVFFYTSEEVAWAESAGRMLLILALMFVALLLFLMALNSCGAQDTADYGREAQRRTGVSVLR